MFMRGTCLQLLMRNIYQRTAGDAFKDKIRSLHFSYAKREEAQFKTALHTDAETTARAEEVQNSTEREADVGQAASQKKTYTTDIPPQNVAENETEETRQKSLRNYRFIYPEFLPDPDMEKRNRMREKLERADMLKRRLQVAIPEFYVGSIMAITVSDPHAPGKVSRFVGICVQRGAPGLRTYCCLRNVVDNQGVEIMYQLYNPTIRKIEVLRLEKRLDDELIYLRDAEPQYSTFPFDMEPEFHPEDEPVPINPLKVKMRPLPWSQRWERYDLKGVEPYTLPEEILKKARYPLSRVPQPHLRPDLMYQYRNTVPEEEQVEVFGEVESELKRLEVLQKKAKRKRAFVRPTKTV